MPTLSRPTQLPNVLASRYASPELASSSGRPSTRSSSSAGCGSRCSGPRPSSASTCPTACIEAYEAVVDEVDLDSIEARERVTRHDVKARIEEFSALAGHEHIHKGMTSRDLTENVEQLQVRDSLVLVRDRMVAALARLARLATEHAEPRDGRPQPQRRRPGDDARQALRHRRRGAPARPRARRGAARPLPAARAQGPDGHGPGPARPARRRPRQARRARGRRRPAPRLRRGCSTRSGRCTRAASTSTSSPPSCRPAAGPVEPGHHVAAHGRPRARHRGVPARPGRQLGDAAQDEHPHPASGSTASPSCCAATCRWWPSSPATSGTRATCRCSVVRRVALPDAFFATDGLFQTFLTVLDELGAYPAVIADELERYLPFLATTKVLVAAVQRGVGREVAHEAIKEHAVAVALAMREDGRPGRRASSSTGWPPTSDSASAGPTSTPCSPTACRSPARPATRSPGSWSASARSSPPTPRRRPTHPARDPRRPALDEHASTSRCRCRCGRRRRRRGRRPRRACCRRWRRRRHAAPGAAESTSTPMPTFSPMLHPRRRRTDLGGEVRVVGERAAAGELAGHPRATSTAPACTASGASPAAARSALRSSTNRDSSAFSETPGATGSAARRPSMRGVAARQGKRGEESQGGRPQGARIEGVGMGTAVLRRRVRR